MAKELERKFLLKEGYDNFFDNFTKQYIEQGYLMLMPGKQLRVRITDNKKAEICYKKQTDDLGIERDEYEYEIPLKDGRELMNSTDVKLVKSRVSIKGVINLDVDTYKTGLTIIEVEFNEGQDFEIPIFCGEEITGRKEYSNIYMALGHAQNIYKEIK